MENFGVYLKVTFTSANNMAMPMSLYLLIFIKYDILALIIIIIIQISVNFTGVSSQCNILYSICHRQGSQELLKSWELKKKSHAWKNHGIEKT